MARPRAYGRLAAYDGTSKSKFASMSALGRLPSIVLDGELPRQLGRSRPVAIDCTRLRAASRRWL